MDALRIAALTAIALSAGCKACESDLVPSAPVVEHPSALSGVVAKIVARDAKHALVLHRTLANAPPMLSAWADGRVLWSVRAPCDPRDGSNWGLVEAGEIAALFCKDPVRDVMRTTGFHLADGTRVWVSPGIEVHDLRYHELELTRAGDVVLALSPKRVIAVDARDGQELWRDEDRDSDVYSWPERGLIAYRRWTTDQGSRLRLLDARSGEARYEISGSAICRLPDALLLVTGNDFLRLALDGKATPIAFEGARPAQVCSPRGDRVIVLRFADNGGLTLAEHDRDGRVLRELVVGRAFNARTNGWEEPLPRFVPIFADPASDVKVVDLDEMRIASVLHLPELGPPPSGEDLTLIGRTDRAWLGINGFQLFGIEAESGHVLATAAPEAQTLFMEDFEASVSSEAMLTAKGSEESLVLVPAVFTASAAFARELERGATRE